MSGSGDFSVTTAGALVVGGIAALVLAVVIALGGYGRPRGPAAPVMDGASGALPAAEVQYSVETTEPASPAEAPTP